jgi:hypothetical protein
MSDEIFILGAALVLVSIVFTAASTIAVGFAFGQGAAFAWLATTTGIALYFVVRRLIALSSNGARK